MLIFASVLLFATRFATPAPAAQMIDSVLRAHAEAKAAGDTEASRDRFDHVMGTVLNKSDRNTDHALAALLAFYLTERASEDLRCEIIHRGAAMLPLLRQYRDHPFKTRERRVYLFDQAERMNRYDSVMESIERGEQCTREH